MIRQPAETSTGLDATPQSPPLIEARHLSVRLGDFLAVDEVSIDAAAGEVVGVIGPNGSGKTTLIRAMAGLVRLAAGEVWLGGVPLADVPVAQRARRIAYMPQFAERHPFTAEELVLMGRYPHLGRFEIEGVNDRVLARAAMERTHTLGFASRQMETLSGGERQRVVLARVLAQQAEVMALDEPTSSLDLRHQLAAMETVREEARLRGAAAVVVMHDLSVAARYCDRLFLMSEGKVISSGPPGDVITSENLRRSFEVEAIVGRDPVTGRPAVTLLGATGAGDAGRPDRSGVTVHVICGAGSGRDLMHQLTVARYHVTAGVLGEGDTDRETAILLGIEHVAAPPFSPVTREQDEAHRALVRAAQHVVVCDMAVNPNNLANLKCADAARSLLVVRRDSSGDGDYTGGQAEAARAELVRRGQEIARHDILRALTDLA